MTVDFYASYPHLIDHLAPLWRELGEHERGTFYVPKPKLVGYAEARGIAAVCDVPLGPGPATIVASHPDYTNVYPSRPIVYVEHGAGQTYSDHPWHPSYSGGSHRDRVVLFLTLNETTAARERATYPDARIEIVGSLRLDDLLSRPARADADSVLAHGGAAATTSPDFSKPLVVACAFHWDCKIVPETRTAWPYWRSAFAELAAHGYPVLGHGHPRIYPELVPYYRRHGIEPVADFAELLVRADVICFDNTSAGYEAAACGVPVVALNAPWYRRHVEHGLRFWDLVPGPQANEPGELRGAIGRARDFDWLASRDAAAAQVYPPWTRGRAARLAADAVRVTLAEIAHV